MDNVNLLLLKIDRYRRLLEAELEPDRRRKITMAHETEVALASLLSLRAAELPYVEAGEEIKTGPAGLARGRIESAPDFSCADHRRLW